MTDTLLLFLLFSLGVLFIFLFYLFLRKDKDLLELQAKYEELQHLEDEEYNKIRLRNDYDAMMVHELRSPLSIIKGSADLLLREESALSADQKVTLLNQVKDSSSDLLDIVNDILDVSKIESGRFEVKKVKGNINKLLQESADYYMALAREKDIVVDTELSNDIPEINFDEDRIKHVMNNLLSNGLKFSDPGSRVVVRSKLGERNMVTVSVEDNGHGIPDAMKGKLFNKFVQMDNRKNVKEKGTGLGLVIAKGIVEAHGGKIWVEDNHPVGAIFAFTIPDSN